MALYLSNKGQTWLMEMIFGVFVFLIVVTIFFRILPGFEDNQQNVEEVFFEARTISESLMSPGSPDNWNSTSMIRPGIIKKNNVVDESKISLFYNLSRSDYDLLRNGFGIRSDFAVYLINPENKPVKIEGEYTASEEGIFEPDSINIMKKDIENLAKVERVVLYNGNPMRLVILAWR